MSNLTYLAKQGIALRGDGDETNSHFMQLLSLRQDENNHVKEIIALKMSFNIKEFKESN